MSQNSPFNPPPFDPDAPTSPAPQPLAPATSQAPAMIEAPAIETVAPAYLPGEMPQSAPRADVLAPEPARPNAATNPLMAMLIGALLSCALIGGGIAIGRKTAGVVASDPNPARDPFVNAIKAVSPTVMNVDTTFGAPPKSKKSKEFLETPGSGGGEGETPPEGAQGKGTGFIFDTKRGLMLTNAHVVAGAKKVQVTTPDGRKISGHVRGYDRASDIAVVIVDDKTLPQAKLAAFTSPKDLDIGQRTFAIGNPFGQENTVTVGVLSAVGRTLPVPPSAGEDAPPEMKDMMQTDTPINPGNSGGPLCNASGEVIGINTAIIPFGQGLGFTIPITRAKAIADQIIKDGKVMHPWIGVDFKGINKQLAADTGLPDTQGGFVYNVRPNSPASQSDIQERDVIRKVNGVTVKDDKAVTDEIKKAKVGDVLKMEVLRNGTEKKTIEIKVGDKPQN